jgi:hypothetical protein
MYVRASFPACRGGQGRFSALLQTAYAESTAMVEHKGICTKPLPRQDTPGIPGSLKAWIDREEVDHDRTTEAND